MNFVESSWLNGSKPLTYKFNCTISLTKNMFLHFFWPTSFVNFMSHKRFLESKSFEPNTHIIRVHIFLHCTKWTTDKIRDTDKQSHWDNKIRTKNEKSQSSQNDRNFFVSCCLCWFNFGFTTLKKKIAYSQDEKKRMSDLHLKNWTNWIFVKYTNKPYFMFTYSVALAQGAIMTRSHKHGLSDLNLNWMYSSLQNKKEHFGALPWRRA